MKSLLSLALVAAIALVATSTTRAADGQISDSQLAGLGLGGMQKMTDVQGTQIRGKFLWATGANSTYKAILTSLGGAGTPSGAAFKAAVQYQNALYTALYPNGIPGTPYGPAGGTGGHQPIIK